jgi:hypothetical protein
MGIEQDNWMLDFGKMVGLDFSSHMNAGTVVASSPGGQDRQPADTAKGANPNNRQQPEITGDPPKQAKLIVRGMGVWEYDFGRMISKEQAAQMIFRTGKVPDEAQLVQGPGKNSWTVKAPDLDAQAATVSKMRTRRETVVNQHSDNGGGTWTPMESGEITVEWDGPDRPDVHGSLSVSNSGVEAEVSQSPSHKGPAPDRRDLKNNSGFVISKRYEVDPGELPHYLARKGLGFYEKALGYEVVFDKPLTSKEVIAKLFTKDAPKEEIVLGPVPSEPWPIWQLKVFGAVAGSSFKYSVFGAFSDAHSQTKESIEPGVPDSIRTHFENKTTPKDAKKHPGDVYVWEAEGYIAWVQTDGKGNYKHEVTKLSSTDEEGNKTLRYFMLEKGMPPMTAWREFMKHWDSMHVGMMQMVGALEQAPRMLHAPEATSRTPSRATEGPERGAEARKTGSESEPPVADGSPPPPKAPAEGQGGRGPSDTIVSHPPPMPESGRASPQTSRRLGVPPGKLSASEAEVVASFKRDSESIVHSQTTRFHEDVWQHLGNKPPSPVAFRVDDRIRVDLQRWPQERLSEIGIKLREQPLDVRIRRGGAGPKAPATTDELAQTGVASEAPMNPASAPTQPQPAPARPSRPQDDSPAAQGDPPDVAESQDSAQTSSQKERQEKPKGLEVDPVRAQKLAAVGGEVYASVSRETHEQAWVALGHEPPAPVVFIVDEQLYVDMDRWPKDVPRPAVRLPPGARKITPANVGKK